MNVNNQTQEGKPNRHQAKL